jgi:hypothetical protein
LRRNRPFGPIANGYHMGAYEDQWHLEHKSHLHHLDLRLTQIAEQPHRSFHISLHCVFAVGPNF